MPVPDHFVSKPTFEGICREHLRRAERASAVGAWWGAVPTGEGRRTEQREIDAVAIDSAGRATALASLQVDVLACGPAGGGVAIALGAPRAERRSAGATLILLTIGLHAGARTPGAG